ncbi:MAG TPA: beta-propeller domain-containing protein, partial [Phytomonospora sp.]
QGAVTETFNFTGNEVDTRQYGSVVRVVASSTPHLRFPGGEDGDSPSESAARNRDAVKESTIGDWMPRYTHKGADGTVNEGTIGCESMKHAFAYSATSMLTVLTFDLNASLGDGAPVTIVADGQTVYGSPTALYVANDRRAFTAAAPEAGTELYRFDVTQPGQPVYAASGSVPGYVLNQYSMSEFEGHLRVATTTDPWSSESLKKSHSGVYVFKQDGEALVEVGRVEGLGKDEQIYAVRYVGPTAYVVTFRQTDPLYVVDLTVPTAPAVAGELKITGFSSYLHPVGPGRLVGVGQEATETGMSTAAQISLFDVSNPAAPGKLADYEVSGAVSEAQYDPHAFLYWEPSKLLVVPIGPSWNFDGAREPAGGALLLRVEDTGLTKVGVIAHDGTDVYTSTINRSLVIGETLWTLSYTGLKATGLDGKSRLAWIDGCAKGPGALAPGPP